MKNVEKSIDTLRAQLERHRPSGLKEYPTRTIFIDPLLLALGWDVRDPDEVELEYPTVDGKSVDYAMKINRKVVFLLEAKQLGDALDDVKSITQVVGYAANDGIDWCVLTNGVRYKVYRASEKASAPEKLLFEVSIDPAIVRACQSSKSLPNSAAYRAIPSPRERSTNWERRFSQPERSGKLLIAYLSRHRQLSSV
jgi:hypothetical protein